MIGYIRATSIKKTRPVGQQQTELHRNQNTFDVFKGNNGKMYWEAERTASCFARSRFPMHQHPNDKGPKQHGHSRSITTQYWDMLQPTTTANKPTGWIWPSWQRLCMSCHARVWRPMVWLGERKELRNGYIDFDRKKRNFKSCLTQ